MYNFVHSPYLSVDTLYTQVYKMSAGKFIAEGNKVCTALYLLASDPGATRNTSDLVTDLML